MGDPWAATARGRRRTGDDCRGYVSSLLLLLPFFSDHRSPSIDHRSPSIDRRRSISPSIDSDGRDRLLIVDFWRYRPVAGSPHTGKLIDRYVPPVPDGTARNFKP
ncbi:hypothetical protein BHM03_00045158 [Ensete ventricosum]|nr:hypothetical protein BHM03_00045158 [Ensete ventricosum]